MDQPSTISRYRLTGELGRGGMGVVYRAEDPQLGRPVAVKVILFPNQASAEQRSQLERRFEREARAAAGIQHPGVITVYDFGRDGDYLYLVMELIEGQSLDQILRQGRRPSRAAAFEIVAQVADALAVAHARGVVHRDVTPRNILIARDGRVIVTDFGVARSLGEETVDLTHTGMLVGSPRYMAPELVRNRDFDGRADLFSLGLVLYYLLTGKPAFTGSDMTSLLYQIVHEDPLADLDLRGSLNRDVVRFLSKSLAKQPEDRFQDAEAFAAEARRLAAAAEGQPEFEETVDLLSPLRSGASRPRADESVVIAPAARRRVGWWVAAVLLLLIFVGSAWAWMHWEDGAIARPNLERSASELESPLDGHSSDVQPPDGQPPDGQPPDIGENLDTLSSAEVDPASQPSLPERAALDQETEEEGLAQQLSAASLEIPPVSPETLVEDLGPSTTPPTISPPTVSSAEPASREKQEPVTRQPAAASRVQDRTVPSQQSPDTVAPVLALDAPPSPLDTLRVTLAGRVLDDRGTVQLTVDGEAVPVARDGEFRIERDLSPGRNVFTFLAVDAAGNQSVRFMELRAPSTNAARNANRGQSNPQGGSQQAQPPQGALRPPARFADRGDGSLLDRRTGLAWTKRLENGLSWRDARDYCEDLELGRAEDWLLPTIEELEEYYSAGTRPHAPPGQQAGQPLGQGAGQPLAQGAGQPVAQQTGQPVGPPPLNFPPRKTWSSSRKGFSKSWLFDFGSGQRQAAARDTTVSVYCVRRAVGQLPGQQRRDGVEDPFGQGEDSFGQPARGERPGGGGPGGAGQRPQGPPGERNGAAPSRAGGQGRRGGGPSGPPGRGGGI